MACPQKQQIQPLDLHASGLALLEQQVRVGLDGNRLSRGLVLEQCARRAQRSAECLRPNVKVQGSLLLLEDSFPRFAELDLVQLAVPFRAVGCLELLRLIELGQGGLDFVRRENRALDSEDSSDGPLWAAAAEGGHEALKAMTILGGEGQPQGRVGVRPG